MRLRSIVVLSALLPLCACFASTEPLLPDSRLAFPVRAGSYDVAGDAKPAKIKLKKGVYVMSRFSREPNWTDSGHHMSESVTPFLIYSLPEAGPGFFIGMRKNDDGYGYSLLELRGDTIVESIPPCDADVPGPVERQGDTCFFSAPDALTRALAAYARRPGRVEDVVYRRR